MEDKLEYVVDTNEKYQGIVRHKISNEDIAKLKRIQKMMEKEKHVVNFPKSGNGETKWATVDS